jgi:hypothetical protein
LNYWQPIVDNTLEVNPQVRFIVEHALHPPKPRGWDHVPAPLWRLLALPMTRTLRVGVLAGVPQKFHTDLGLRVSLIDRAERRIHGTFWRFLPRRIVGRFGPIYFGLRRRFGQPGWRTVYSRNTLQANRGAATAAR